MLGTFSPPLQYADVVLIRCARVFSEAFSSVLCAFKTYFWGVCFAALGGVIHPVASPSAHSSFWGGIESGWWGQDLKCACLCVCGGEVSSNPCGEYVFFICLYNRSAVTAPQSGFRVWAQMGACKYPVRCNPRNINVPLPPHYNKAVHSKLNMEAVWGILEDLGSLERMTAVENVQYARFSIGLFSVIRGKMKAPPFNFSHSKK